jgi:hypothetical protein
MLEVGQRWYWSKLGDIFVITEIRKTKFSYRYESGPQLGREFDAPKIEYIEYVTKGVVVPLTPLMEALL